MKKTFSMVTILLFGASVSFSQETKTDKPKEAVQTKKVVQTRPAVATRIIAPMPPAPTPAASNTKYYMTSARVIIETGNDNKEQLSQLQIFLNRRIGNYPHSVQFEVGLYDYMTGNHPKEEYKINSTVELTMDCSVQLPNAVSEGWRYGCLNLDIVQDAGLELTIYYSPNFPLDAWKIEKVTLVLEFKDLAGNPHPTMGRVTVPFQHASKLLHGGNNEDQTLTLKTDRFLIPLN
jgi:hypothetical protein